MLAALALLALTADARPWLPKNAGCSDDPKALHDTLDVPEEFVLGELHHAPMIDTAEQAEKLCRLTARAYDKKARLWVGAVETAVLTPSGAGGYVVGPRTVVLGLFKFGDEALVTVAKTETPVTLAQDEAFTGFDLAAFKLDEKKKAFGFRSRRNVAYAGGGGTNEKLWLFRDTDAAEGLALVFEALMASHSTTAGDWHPDHTRDHQENDGGSAVIQVAKTKTGGVFDWDKVVLATRKKATYRWTGKRFETKDADPVEDQNGE
ncbi:MAG: hypothetical protein QM723_31285 [Myxococcaceae bacterium]